MFKNIRTGDILLNFAFNFNWPRVKLGKIDFFFHKSKGIKILDLYNTL